MSEPARLSTGPARAAVWQRQGLVGNVVSHPQQQQLPGDFFRR